jgi:sulfur relay (sulfurtransferase) DsrC/TusE family protein
MITMIFKSLNTENFSLFAVKHYDNPHCHSMQEFEEDLTRIIYLKRLFKKYKRSGELRDRLILNHLITFYNVFGIEPATRMLFYKMDADLLPLLKTFLVYLHYLPENTKNIEGIDIVEIPLENEIIEKLRSL